MNALALPCSSSGSTSIAMPSTATSCAAPKQFSTKHSAVSVTRLSSPSGKNANASPVSARPSCATSTQGRLRPMARYVKRSIIGPASHLKVHGSIAAPTNPPTAAGLVPRSSRNAGNATVTRPNGKPLRDIQDREGEVAEIAALAEDQVSLLFFLDRGRRDDVTDALESLDVLRLAHHPGAQESEA